MPNLWPPQEILQSSMESNFIDSFLSVSDDASPIFHFRYFQNYLVYKLKLI
eukprot:UN02178